MTLVPALDPVEVTKASNLAGDSAAIPRRIELADHVRRWRRRMLTRPRPGNIN